jgi:hypothetical protein
VLPDKQPLRFAAAVAQVTGDPALAARLAEAGTRRVAGFSLEHSRHHFVDLIRQAIAA